MTILSRDPPVLCENDVTESFGDFKSDTEFNSLLCGQMTTV